MTEQEFCSKPRYLYQIADYYGIDKRTLCVRLKACGCDLCGREYRLLLPYQVRRIMDMLRCK